MLYITDSFIEHYFKVSKDLNEFFNKKAYKVSSTPLTYRQINALDADSLLTNDRASEKKWRKFSFKDLVYISLVNELKGFGLKHAQLETLHEAFYKTKSTDAKEIDKKDYISKTVSEIALGCVFSRVEIRLCIKSDGQLGFYDPMHFILENNSQSQIVINFSGIVSELVQQLNGEPLKMLWKLDKYFLDSVATEEDENLLEIIKNKNFRKILLEKKDGKVWTIHAEQANEDKSISIKNLITAINAKDYQKIIIIKRDGKIVNIKVEETIKLNH